LVIDVKVVRFGGRELRRLSLDEALSDLVAVEGMIHKECGKFLVVGVVVVVVTAVTCAFLGVSALCVVVFVLCWARGLELCF